MIIYVGDGKDIVKRVRNNHCRGNIEASALRKHLAIAKGYNIKTSQRNNGSTRVRIDLPDPRVGESDISSYIQSGEWKLIICNSYLEANDFQWYAIEHLNPLLNVTKKMWNKDNSERYQSLLEILKTSPSLKYKDLNNAISGPGVYVLYHDKRP